VNRERALLVLLGALLAASVVLHVHHLLTGSQTFWIGVTLLMTAFCLVSSVLLLGGAGTAVFFLVGIALGLFFEATSIQTGFPFGRYYYTPLFGPGLLHVPFIIPLAWYVIVYLGYVMANLMIEHAPVAGGGVARALWLSLVGAGIVTAYDLAADPFMVRKIGAWVMIEPGDYFGEQLRGFAGWTLVSFLIAAAARLGHRQIDARPALPITVLSAAYPVLAYAIWWLFFSVAGYPRGTRVIAVYAMGVPTLAAVSGLMAWRRTRTAAPRATEAA
jgi:putative membrane protein